LAPRAPERGVVRELDRVAVDDEEVLLAFEQRLDALDPAAGTEDLRLEGEVKLGVVRGQEVLLERLGQMMQVHDEIADPGAEERLRRPSDQRAVADRHERLRHGIGRGTHAGAVTGGEDHGPHQSCSGENTMSLGRSARVRRAWRYRSAYVCR